jgi:hypothetical protein
LGKVRQSFALIAPPSVLDGDILTLDIANLTEAAPKCGYERCIRFRARVVEEPNDRQGRRLRARRERPSRHAAEKRDELAPPHELPSDEDHTLPHR